MHQDDHLYNSRSHTAIALLTLWYHNQMSQSNNQMYLDKYKMRCCVRGFWIECSLMFLEISTPLRQISINVSAANNSRRCLWERQCFLSGRSFLIAGEPDWVCRVCLIHWLRCDRDEQTEVRGQSSARTEHCGKKKRPRHKDISHLLTVENVNGETIH